MDWNTINRYFTLFRRAILRRGLAEKKKEGGAFELDV
jgi:hypothetical protein